MDIQILFFYFSISTTLALLGYWFKNRNLAGLSLFGFVFTGLSVLFKGIDGIANETQTSLLNATDLYSYTWNTTFNTSAVANITTQLNRTLVTSYSYLNLQDSTTSTFGAILIGIGILVGMEAYLSGGKQKKDGIETV